MRPGRSQRRSSGRTWHRRRRGAVRAAEDHDRLVELGRLDLRLRDVVRQADRRAAVRRERRSGWSDPVASRWRVSSFLRSDRVWLQYPRGRCARRRRLAVDAVAEAVDIASDARLRDLDVERHDAHPAARSARGGRPSASSTSPRARSAASVERARLVDDEPKRLDVCRSNGLPAGRKHLPPTLTPPTVTPKAMGAGPPGGLRPEAPVGVGSVGG